MTAPIPSAIPEALLVRDPSHFHWSIVTFFALVVWIYVNEIREGRSHVALAGLAFWGMDWLNEILNGLVFHLTGVAPVWGLAGESSYKLLIGLNAEICLMFAVAGIGFVRMLPRSPKTRILGMQNRLFIASTGSFFCVLVEIWLHRIGVLTWEWPFWNAREPWLIFLLGYLPFFLVAFKVYDEEDPRRRIKIVGTLLTLDIAALILFVPILGWI